MIEEQTEKPAKPVCRGKSKSGKPCCFRAWPGDPEGLCFYHSKAPGAEEASKAFSAHAGRFGGAALRAIRLSRKREACPLGTVAEIRHFAEQLALQVMNSGAEQIKKASAGASIIRASLELLRCEELAKENAELRQILIEKHPELRGRLLRLA